MIPATPDAARTRFTGSGRRRDLRQRWTCLLICLCMAANPDPAACADATSVQPASRFLRFDSVRSNATFGVRALLMFTVQGQFGSVSGGVRVDSDQASVEAVIDANAVSMNRKSYENWVKSAEFFDVDRHPQIFFDSSPFPLARLREGGLLPGTLRMRGVSRPVEFKLSPSKCEQPAIDCAVVAHGTVRRSEFGMNTHRGSLSDKVELNFSVRVLAPVAGSAES